MNPKLFAALMLLPAAFFVHAQDLKWADLRTFHVRGSAYVSRLSRDLATTGPEWNPSEPLPLAFSAVEQIARNELHKLVPGEPPWNATGFSLCQLIGTRHWFYCVRLMPSGPRKDSTYELSISFSGIPGIVEQQSDSWKSAQASNSAQSSWAGTNRNPSAATSSSAPPVSRSPASFSFKVSGTNYSAGIDWKALTSAPVWNTSQPLPLTFSVVEQIGRRELRKLVRDETQWVVDQFQVERPVAIRQDGEESQHWYYMVRYRARVPNKPPAGASYYIPVFVDFNGNPGIIELEPLGSHLKGELR